LKNRVAAVLFFYFFGKLLVYILFAKIMYKYNGLREGLFLIFTIWQFGNFHCDLTHLRKKNVMYSNNCQNAIAMVYYKKLTNSFFSNLKVLHSHF
jgi:hypothetical protein